MSVAIGTGVSRDSDEPRFDIHDVKWDTYVTMNEALGDRRNPRMIHCEGRLTLMERSWIHMRLASLLDHLIMAIASYAHVDCEPSGAATYRHRQKEAGLEADRTFHFGDNAERMRGGRDYDFDRDPPPDLAIEVEVTNPADEAIAAWGRLGVPEVWRFDAAARTCSFWNRSDDGSYEQVARSLFLPMLHPLDVVDQIRTAQEIGTSKWYAQLGDWVRDVILPRMKGA
jgi:Uma2 family endonuclease